MPLMKLRVWLAGVAGLVGLLAAPSLVAALPLDTPSTRLSLTPQPGVSGSGERQLATWSIDAYVEKHRPASSVATLLDHVDPMPLVQAAALIKKDQSRRGDLVRRVALLRLLTWVRKEREVRGAVETIVGDRAAVERIYRMLDAAEAGTGCEGVEDEVRQLAVNKAVNQELKKLQYKSCPDIGAMLASVVNKGDTVIVASKVIAQASLPAVREGLDPQRWKTCSPLWKASYLVSADSAGNPIGNGHCVPDDHVDCLPIEGTAQPYGGAYDTDVLRQPFFERFVCDDGWCDVRLLLRIVTRVPPASQSAYYLSYDRPQKWMGFPFPPDDQGTVTVDAVELPATTDKEVTVKADKTFGFGNWGTTFAIYFLLRQTEMATYLADLVCCP